MGEADVRVAAVVVVTALREAGRSEGTIRRYQAVLDRFAAFLAGRGLINSLSAEGMFRVFCGLNDHYSRYRFGQELDGSPTPPWGWNDLH